MTRCAACHTDARHYSPDGICPVCEKVHDLLDVAAAAMGYGPKSVTASGRGYERTIGVLRQRAWEIAQLASDLRGVPPTEGHPK